MAIFGHGYRPLHYEPVGAARRWLPLAHMEWRSLLRTRWGFSAYLLCAVPSLISLLLLLFHVGFVDLFPRGIERDLKANGLSPTALRFYLDPILVWSYLPFLLLTTMVSSRAVAKDRASGALEILWTRSISPWGYFLGKWCGSLALLGVLFFVLPLVIWILGVLMGEGWTVLEQTAPFMPRFFLAMLVLVVVLSFIPTAFSALAATPGFSSMLWVGAMLGTWVIHRISDLLRSNEPYLKVIDPWEAGVRISKWIVGMKGIGDEQVVWALCSLGTIVLVLIVALARKLRTATAVAS
jgi:ABC-type transport system involved in multi-copper enzyme maturation permease subunit